MSVLTTISPITNEPIIETPVTTWDELTSKVLPTSVSAQKSWYKNNSLAQRKKIVSAFVDLLSDEATATRLGKEITEQMGRPIRYTPGEVSTAALRVSTLLKFADAALAPVAANSDPSDTEIKFEGQFKKYLTHEPLGTVLIIFPWNYPYLTLVNALIPALLVGNSVIIKPSPQTPKVADEIVKLFEKAGLPSGVLQAIHSGDNDMMAKLISTRSEIAAVSFTGSVPGGLAVQKAAANRTIPIALELGGNDAAYVRKDADLAYAVENIVDGAIFNSGQSCCSIERVYVHESVYDEFVKLAVKEVKGYKIGDPFNKDTQIGPVVSAKSAEGIRAQIKEGVEKHGGKVLVGEPDFKTALESLPETFVAPTLITFDDPDTPALVLKEETFGPVLPVVKVSGDEEAVRLINDSQYGLTASVWTDDLEKGEELGDEIEAGTVFVNRADYPDPNLAWTGYKNSGRAVSLSKYGFAFFGKLKSHHIKKPKI